MTLFKQIDQLLDRYDSANVIAQPELSIFKNVPFYHEWTNMKPCKDTNPRCFNCLVHLPKKAGITKPLFDYQHELFDTLQNHKLVWLLKATGLGITEFMIRYIAWLCLKDDQLKGSQIVIITGPRLEYSVSIIERMKHLFIDSEITTRTFDTKQTVIELNGTRITAYPSDHLDDARGIPNVSFIYVDEAAFFSPKEQNNLRDVIERYLIKSNPWITLVSTPNKPDDIMNQIMNEKNSLYTKLYFDYTVGVGENKMWTPEEIEHQMQSPSFQREYNLRFLGGIGNVFHTKDIDFITNDHYNPLQHNPMVAHFMGVDPGFGPSDTAIVVTRYQNQKLEVIHAETISKGLYEDILRKIVELIEIYGVGKVYVDGSALHLIGSLKVRYNEYTRWDLVPEETVRNWILTDPNEPKIVPVAFAKFHRDMLKKLMFCVSKHTIRIDKRFDKLITGLRSATAKDDNYSLNKEQTVYSDLIDALRLSILVARFKGE